MTQVRVVDSIIDAVSEVGVDLPISMQRCVEESPIRYQLIIPVADAGASSNISYAEFYLDGRRLGEAFVPFYETRNSKDGYGQEYG